MNLNRARCIEGSRGCDVGAISESDGGRVVDVCPVNQNIDVTNRRTARAQAVPVFRKLALFKRVVRIQSDTAGFYIGVTHRNHGIGLVIHERHGASA